MRHSDLLDMLTENGLEDAFFIDNPAFDTAIIGFDIAGARLVYSFDKLVKIAMEVLHTDMDSAADYVADTFEFDPTAANPVVVHEV